MVQVLITGLALASFASLAERNISGIYAACSRVYAKQKSVMYLNVRRGTGTEFSLCIKMKTGSWITTFEVLHLCHTSILEEACKEKYSQMHLPIGRLSNRGHLRLPCLTIIVQAQITLPSFHLSSLSTFSAEVSRAFGSEMLREVPGPKFGARTKHICAAVVSSPLDRASKLLGRLWLVRTASTHPSPL